MRNRSRRSVSEAARKQGLKVTSSIRSGGITPQHNRRGLKVRAGVKAGGIDHNHNPIALALAAVLKKAAKIRRGLRRG